ncbi:MAG: hypothetical protein AAGF83_03615 [Cyanobacteria bacterium P01_G01_bin.67]
MGHKIATGLSATRNSLHDPDLTFIWDVEQKGDVLDVSVKYGRGNAIIRVGEAIIPLGSSKPVDVSPTYDRNIFPQGTVSASWAEDNKSYAVTFSGQMISPGVNNIISSDQNIISNEPEAIIVYVHLDR